MKHEGKEISIKKKTEEVELFWEKFLILLVLVILMSIIW